MKDQNYAKTITKVWDLALASAWERPLVWIHGDIAVGNLLVNNGQLSAVIDFGQLGIGDPACDLAIAWTLFRGESREAFRAALKLDSATLAHGRGWANTTRLLISVFGKIPCQYPPNPMKTAIVYENLMQNALGSVDICCAPAA